MMKKGKMMSGKMMSKPKGGKKMMMKTKKK